VEFFKALFKVSVVGLCLWQVIRDAFIKMPELIAMSLPQAVAWGGSIVWQMIIRCSFGLCVIAVADYAFQWWENERSLMMSRKELTEELKETEGRPEIKQRIRQRQRQIATGRMMANVKKADVVVANPDHFAVALKYEAGAMMAPVVLAKGAGWLAQRIKEEARAHRVTIIENPPVARALHASVEVGEPVPPSLYQAVAEILAFVYSLKTKAQRPVLEEVEE
jgi:flagellar biosynthetic protein FlhB